MSRQIIKLVCSLLHAIGEGVTVLAPTGEYYKLRLGQPPPRGFSTSTMPFYSSRQTTLDHWHLAAPAVITQIFELESTQERSVEYLRYVPESLVDQVKMYDVTFSNDDPSGPSVAPWDMTTKPG
ncbi:hypothetical protein EDC04DRAFT_2608798 [Pisolithus marmoratus]|nr:hypothetical protein EDC04DRAFT_2608798 [Pisolithus marmoratus]